MNTIGYLTTFFLLASGAAFSEWGSTVSVPEFSPAHVALRWKADCEVPGVTYTVFYRNPSAQPGFWHEVPSCTDTTAQSGLFDASPYTQVEFRSAMQTEGQPEQRILTDFEEDSDYMSIGFVGHQIGFQCEFKSILDDPANPTPHMQMLFRYVFEDREHLKPEYQVGFPFNHAIGATDWSGYRYLEMMYWSEEDDPMHLLIASASGEFRVPVLSLTEKEPCVGWNALVVDLERLGPPEARRNIKAFALVATLDEIDLDRAYRIKVDEVSLWRTRRIAATTIDPTPPVVKALHHTIQGKTIVWSWEAEDPESGMAGYSYYWGKNRGSCPSEEIQLIENTLTLPYDPPNYPTFLHLMVKAKNRAGLWSETAIESLEFF